MNVVEGTNNVLECFFGRQKQQLRRRVGRAHLGRDLQDQPAQAALSANLHYSEYVRVLCGSLDHLAEAFADLDQDGLDQGSPLSRDNRDSALQRRVRTLLAANEPLPTRGSVQARPDTIGSSATVV